MAAEKPDPNKWLRDMVGPHLRLIPETRKPDFLRQVVDNRRRFDDERASQILGRPIRADDDSDDAA